MSPQEGWISDGRQALHFNQVRYSRYSQALELTTGVLIAGQAPLLKCRKEIRREEAIKLWAMSGDIENRATRQTIHRAIHLGLSLFRSRRRGLRPWQRIACGFLR
ncbi:DUF1651 domain-containing protein [Cyanobium sp. BA20m-p-22]|nr:DUF1651 domain-containing protein [Cyanobium sp. BA20m-p-22]MCP9910950.1 DUF1651 domain-containing protein [Cyanobium sp. BA20m-p-22]